MVDLFSTASKESQVGVEFLRDGVAVAQLRPDRSHPGKYLDVLKYMQTLEQLDWKLLWDEIEILGEEYPTITLKLVMSTPSTRKEWIGI